MVSAAVGSIIAATIAAAATIGGTVISSRNAAAAQDRQLEYQKQVLAQQRADEAAEKKLQKETQDRNRAYGASLLDGNSQLDNILTSSWDGSDSDEGATELTTTSDFNSGGVASMFA